VKTRAELNSNSFNSDQIYKELLQLRSRLLAENAALRQAISTDASRGEVASQKCLCLDE
jgi:hypothetical protein